MLEFRNVSYFYEDPTDKIFDKLSFSIQEKAFTCIIGLNGAGKSTLAKLAVGALSPREGEICYQNKILSYTNIGYLPQKRHIRFDLPLSVYDFVLMGTTQTKKLFFSKEDKQHTHNTIISCGLEGFEHVPMKNLSGGQAQRACIARMLVSTPEYIVLDEPFDSLDVRGSESLLELLLYLKNTLTILMISHNPEMIARLADKTICISNQEEHHTFIDYFFKQNDIPVMHICKH